MEPEECCTMPTTERTPRQRIMDLLRVTPLSSRRLAEIVAISERQVEEHLSHIVQSVTRDRLLQFRLDPSECQDCGFVFRDRGRITRPSRCPRCRSEAITEPRYYLERRSTKRD